jgi:hypothetical protein
MICGRDHATQERELEETAREEPSPISATQRHEGKE